MIPASSNGRFLVLIHGHSKLDILSMPSIDERPNERATLGYSALINVLQSSLEPESCAGKVLTVVSGLQTQLRYQAIDNMEKP